MKKYSVLILFLAAILLTASPVWASVGEASATVVDGAVNLPLSLVKLVGGVVWLVGEVLILPFRLL